MVRVESIRLPFKNHKMDTVYAKTSDYTVLFDTGVYSTCSTFDEIFENQTVILNTHGDWDHIGANKYLQDKGAKVFVHEADFMKLIDQPRQWYTGHTQFYREFPVLPEDSVYFDKEGGQALVPNGELYDGQVFEFDELKVQVIHTPGHSGGCCSFYLEKEGILITGDTLQARGFYGLGTVLSNAYAWKNSMKKLLDLDCVDKTYIAHAYEIGQPENILLGTAALHEKASECLKVAEAMEDALRAVLEERSDDSSLSLRFLADTIYDKINRPHGFGGCLTALSFLRNMVDEYPVAARICSEYEIRI